MNRSWLCAGTGAALLLATTVAPHADEVAHGRPHICPARLLSDPAASGVTTVSFIVVHTGGVTDVAVAGPSGDPRIDAASLACVRNWRYKPVVQNGTPKDMPWTANIVWNPQRRGIARQILQQCGNSIPQNQRTARRDTGFLVLTDDDEQKFSSVMVASPSGDDVLDSAEADCLANTELELRETVVVSSPSSEPGYVSDSLSPLDVDYATVEVSPDGPPRTDVGPAASASPDWREGAKDVPAATDKELISMIVGKAFAHLLQHKYDLATKEFGMAIARYPDRPDFYAERCAAYVDSEDHYDLAVADCSKAITLQEQQSHPIAGYYVTRGDALVGARQYEKAVVDYDHAMTLDTKDLRILLYRCEARAAWGNDLRKGWNDCASYVNTTGGDARSREAMSLIRWRLQDYPVAIAQADMSLAMYAKRAPALYLRGIAKLKAGDAAGGQADVAAAKAIDPKIAQTYAAYGVTP
jgi:TonB family protein